MLQSSPRAAHQASPLKPTGRHFHLPLPLRNVPYGCRRKWSLSFPATATASQMLLHSMPATGNEASPAQAWHLSSFPSWFADKLYPRQELPGQLHRNSPPPHLGLFTVPEEVGRTDQTLTSLPDLCSSAARRARSGCWQDKELLTSADVRPPLHRSSATLLWKAFPLHLEWTWFELKANFPVQKGHKQKMQHIWVKLYMPKGFCS